jgi:hypothetical protein
MVAVFQKRFIDKALVVKMLTGKNEFDTIIS